jgi:hypothetical protein
MRAMTRMWDISAGGIGALADRIAATRTSEVLREQLWVVPTSQSIHIIAVSVLFASALIASLRVLSLGRSERQLSAVIGKNAILIYGSLMALLVTGTVQLIAEPVRQLLTPAFWAKMLLVVVGLTLTYWFANKVRRDPRRWDLRSSRPAWSPLYAVIIFATWTAVIVCGRFIGYTHR